MNKQIKILLIDDDESLSRVLEHQLAEEGHHVTVARDGNSGLVYFNKNIFDVVITDISMPGLDGLQLLQSIRVKNDRVVIILITAYGTVENAIDACNLGADDYLTKPFSIEQLIFAMEKALHHRDVEKENLSLKTQLHTRFGLDALVGQGFSMQHVYQMIQKVAPRDTTVLIQGESGTGKELVARAIHTMSTRDSNPFIAVDCAAIPNNLMESELFGHMRGAFSGAIKDRIGKFESADGGTLFLDEIGDLKEDLQAKLLRTLQERQINKVGSEKSVPVDVRIIAATNLDLDGAVQEKKFRQDLYFRLAVIIINIPPLRERREDIPDLVDHFFSKYQNDKIYQVEKEVYQALKGYQWPGNVRELENVIERATVLSDDVKITLNDLPESIRSGRTHRTQRSEKTLEDIEKNAIRDALKETGGNQSRAAGILGVPRHVLLYRLKKWGIQAGSP